MQFKFERRTINHENVLPSFFIENNTREVCEFVFDDPNDNISIPPQCLSGSRKNKPFKFMGIPIDPLNFYSPQFISDKYSFAVFTKGKERYISINSPLLLKDKTNVNLFYQERHSDHVIELFKKSITSLYKLTAEFGIYIEVEKDGTKGFFIGIGKGVGGIIADPVAGLIDIGTGIVDEIKNDLGESRDSMRFPRVFNNNQIQEYDRVSAICQLQYQRYIKNYDDNFVYFVNGKDKFLGITESYFVFLIPNDNENDLNIDTSYEFKVSKLRLISDVDNVCAFNNFLIIKFIDESGYDIECKSLEIADIATKIIVSRSYYCNYITNSSNMTKIVSTDFSSSDENEEKEEIEQKTIIIKDGLYNIKSTNNKYVTNDNESSPLIANREEAKDWEKIKITNNVDRTISFLSIKNNKYVTVGRKSSMRGKYKEYNFECQEKDYSDESSRFGFIRYVQEDSWWNNYPYRIYLTYFELYSDVFQN